MLKQTDECSKILLGKMVTILAQQSCRKIDENDDKYCSVANNYR